MNTSQSTITTRVKVGLFALFGLFLVGLMAYVVNDRPMFWKPCQVRYVNVDDATGLTNKSPVRTLGLDIGYIKSIELRETHVRLGICITAPVEILPSTRAFLRGEGFLGDKFVELKPVRYVGENPERDVSSDTAPSEASPGNSGEGERGPGEVAIPRSNSAFRWSELFLSRAHAAPPASRSSEIPVGSQAQDVQEVVNQVNDLVKEMTTLTNSLQKAIDPQELKQTMNQLNRTLENASKTLSPQGQLTTTAQRTLAKLEDAIEQLRDQMTRINRGEGSVGRVLNDPYYAEQLKLALENINKLLGRVSQVQFIVDAGLESLPAYNGERGWFRLGIWPQSDRYYLLGVTIDPRGKREVSTRTTTTTANGQTFETFTRDEKVEQTGILLTGMLGKVFWNRVDLSAGVLHGDGTASLILGLGPGYYPGFLTYRVDVYSRGVDFNLDARNTISLKPWHEAKPFSSLYLSFGVENIRKVDGQIPWLFGAGLRFEDDDIKLLFSLR